MNVLLRNARITYPGHKHHGKKLDVYIEKGIIKAIGKSLSPKSKFHEVKSNNLHVSPGWIDMRANFAEPGYEERETITTGCKAAASGGYTAVCLSPKTNPITDNRASVEYLVNASKNELVQIHPLGALSQGLNGADLSEMFDMQQAGAVGFCDDKRGIQNAKFMQLALEYAKGINALVMSFPMEKNLQGKAQVNEGVNSTLAGLKGIPHLAEEVMVNRDLYLVDYTQGKAHFTGLSSAKSIELISKAKKAGAQVSAEIGATYLIQNDDCLNEFDSNYKVLPPLRTEKDRKALVDHVNKGNIQVIVSDHVPHNIENKACEFELASYGMIGIQTTFALLNTKLKGKITPDTFVNCSAINPRNILGIEIPDINEGSEANLTWFDPDIKWTYDQGSNLSKSRNSPYIGEEFIGKVLGVCNKGLVQQND